MPYSPPGSTSVSTGRWPTGGGSAPGGSRDPTRSRAGSADPPRAARGDLFQELAKHSCVRVFRISGRVDQGHRSPLGSEGQVDERIATSQELHSVAFSESREPFRLMAEPGAQLLARGELTPPGVDPRPFLRHAAGPEPVDEHADAIGGGWGIVDALRLDHLVVPSETCTRRSMAKAKPVRPDRESRPGAMDMLTRPFAIPRVALGATSTVVEIALRASSSRAGRPTPSASGPYTCPFERVP